MLKILNGREVKIIVNTYYAVDQLVIEVIDVESEEYLFMATVCIRDERLTRKNMKEMCEASNDIVLIKNYSENTEYYNWLKEANIIKEEILGTVKSGFVDIPFHELTDEFQYYVNQNGL